MRRGDAGCCASAALARPNGPRQATRARRRKGKRAGSPDHLIRAQQDRLWDGETERFGGLEIDHQFELGRLLDRQIAWLGTLQDLVDVFGRSAEEVIEARSIGDQRAVRDEVLRGNQAGIWILDASARSSGDELERRGIVDDEQSLRVRLAASGEACVEYGNKRRLDRQRGRSPP